MKNQEKWTPSKFEFIEGRYCASRKINEVGIASRLVADLDAEIFSKFIPLHCSGSLIDLGCGKVPLFELYKKYTSDVYCVDWDNSDHRSEHIDQYCDLNTLLPIAKEKFNTVILTDVLEHIFKPELLWNEIHRILKPSGKAIINLPFMYWIHEDPHDYYRYTEFALRKFAKNSGFEVILIETHGGALEIIADVMAKNIQHVPLFGNSLAQLVQWITMIFRSFTIGKTIARKTSKKFPLGYFLVVQKK